MTNANLLKATLLALDPYSRPLYAIPMEGPQASYLLFQSDSDFTLGVRDNRKHWDGTLKYSTDAETWTEWDGTTTLSSANGKLYFRGIENTVITGPNNVYDGWNINGSNVECVGNIENILDYASVARGIHPSMSAYCFQGLFRNCTSLTKAPDMSATTVSSYCYYRMFEDCINLTAAPEILPATRLASSYDYSTHCYAYMFSGCTSLTTAPKLPATQLAQYCYVGMFSYCTSLTTAPELPATNVTYYCYGHMFKGCTSLTTAPELPATYLDAADGFCYHDMFSGCTSLTTAPKLPATNLAQNCYWTMFYGCTSLTTAPELPATRLVFQCYVDMFYGCTSLKLSETQNGEYQYPFRIPKIGTGTEDQTPMDGMFYGTGGTFTGTPTINTTYYTDHPLVEAAA